MPDDGFSGYFSDWAKPAGGAAPPAQDDGFAGYFTPHEPTAASVPAPGVSTTPPASAVDDTAPRQPGNFHPMPSALDAPIAAFKQAFGDPSTLGDNVGDLGNLVNKPGESPSLLKTANSLLIRGGATALDLVPRLLTAGTAATTAAAGNILKEVGFSDTSANKLIGDMNLEMLRRGTTDIAPSGAPDVPRLLSSDVAPNKLGAVVTPSVGLPMTSRAVGMVGDVASGARDMITVRDAGPQYEAQLLAATQGDRPASPVTAAAAATGAAETAPAAVPSAPRNALAEVPPAEAAPGENAPVPQSAGAAATTAQDLATNAPSERELLAERATGEDYRLAQGAPKGQDKTVYVEGEEPTLAETSGNVGIAMQQRQIQSTDQTGQVDAQIGRSDEARVLHAENLAKTPTIVMRMEQAREQRADALLGPVWGKKQPTDATPVLKEIQSVLDSGAGKVEPVAAAMRTIDDRMVDKNGQIETDPQILYGVRRQINYMLSKTGQIDKPGYREATAELLQVRGALDKVIESGAPGFKKYLEAYAEDSRPIDALNLLQDELPRLKDAKGVITLNRVNSMMKRIVADRKERGVNAAKSLDDDQMEGLWNLRSSLLRKGNLDLGTARGSPTFANQTIGASMGLTGAHVAASHFPGGNLLLGQRLDAVKGQRLAIIRNRLLDGMRLPGEGE